MITLDRQSLDGIATPLWLVDPQSDRVLWANAAARAAWGGATPDPAAADALETEALDALRALPDATPDTTRTVAWPASRTPGAPRVTAELHPVTVEGMSALLVVPQGRLAEERAILDLLLRSPLAVSVFDAEGGMLHCNSAAREIYGGNAGSLAARFAEGADHAALLEHLAERGRASVAARMRGADPDEERWHLVDASAATDPCTGAPLIEVIEADIRALREVEDSLRRSAEQADATVRARTDFLSAMAHEIRNTMMGVMGFSSLLLRRLPDGPEHELAQQLVRSGEALERIANQMLDLSRIEAGQLVLDSVEFRPFNLFEPIRRTHEMAARDKGLDFEVIGGVGANIPRLGDNHRIGQIIDNLVGNAIRFTAEGGVRVRISGPRDGPLRIEVADTGIGIAADQRDRIFQPYTQASPDTARRFGGTGLGLHIVKDLVASMNGRLGLESEPGRGSTFTVILPLPLAPSAASKTGCRPARLPAGLKVLTIESASLDGAVLELLLSRQSVDATPVSTAAEGLTAFARGGFDAVLVDSGVADMGAAEILAALRRIEEEEKLGPVAIVLLGSDRLEPEEGRRVGAAFDGHVSKPLRFEELTACMANAVSDARERPRRPRLRTADRPGS